MKRAWMVSLAAIVGWLAPTLAWGQQERLNVALSYSAPPACPNQEGFWAALRARTLRVEPSSAADADVLLRLDLTRDDAAYLGRLEIVRDGFATEPRYVESADCQDVVQALALTAALGIDPDALTRRPSQAPAEQQDTKPIPGRYKTVRATPPTTWRTRLSTSAVTALLIDVDTSWGLEAALALDAVTGAGWKPTVNIGATMLRSDIFGAVEFAHFELYAFRINGCPVGVRTGIDLRICLASQVGMLSAEGRNYTTTQISRRSWATLGAALELDVPLSRRLALALQFAGHIPMTPQTYSVRREIVGAALELEDEQVARTPALIPWLSIGLSYEL